MPLETWLDKNNYSLWMGMQRTPKVHWWKKKKDCVVFWYDGGGGGTYGAFFAHRWRKRRERGGGEKDGERRKWFPFLLFFLARYFRRSSDQTHVASTTTTATAAANVSKASMEEEAEWVCGDFSRVFEGRAVAVGRGVPGHHGRVPWPEAVRSVSPGPHVRLRPAMRVPPSRCKVRKKRYVNSLEKNQRKGRPP